MTKIGVNWFTIGRMEALRPPSLAIISMIVKYYIVYLLCTKFIFKFMAISVTLN